MVAATRIDGGATQIPVAVRETIQSIKEIVGDHSDTDIYLALKETGMDPNETAGKLLYQDTFHEVKRKRDKRKEVSSNSIDNKVPGEPRRNYESVEPRRHSESVDPRRHSESVDPRRHSESVDPRRHSESVDPRRHSESVDPRRHSESVDPRRHSESVDPESVDPKRHSESVDPKRHSESVDPRRHSESVDPRRYSERVEPRRHSERVEPRRHFESAGQGPKSYSDRYVPKSNTYYDHNVLKSPTLFERNVPKSTTDTDRYVRRGAHARNGLPGINREFRVKRDNRVNGNIDREMKPASPETTSTNEQVPSIPEKSPTGSSSNQKPSSRQISSPALNREIDPQNRTNDVNSNGTVRKKTLVEKRGILPNSASRVQAGKPINSQPQVAVVVSSNSVVGVYSSSTDPVHVPSPDSRPSASVGAIKREVGVVGVRRPSSENSKSSAPSTFSNSLLGSEGSTESFRPFTGISKTDQVSQTSEPAMPSMSAGRPLSNQQNVRPHQQPVGHQKASLLNKEWKPKSSQKQTPNPGVIGTPPKSVSPHAGDSKVSESEAAKLQDKLSEVNIYDNCNVVIAQNIRIPESDRFRLTFGSLGTEVDSTGNVDGFQTGPEEESNREPVASLSVAAPESFSNESSGLNPVDLLEDQVRNSGSDSPASSAVLEPQLSEKKETPSPHNFDNYGDIGLVRDNSTSYAASHLQQQDPPELQGFTAFDPQTGYDMPYFRPTMEESVRGQGLVSHQEALNSHTVNSMAASTVGMVQQQPTPVAQMYPQVHYANLMPYRQFLSPVYVPPMAVPGYSSNPAYPHMSSGNSYMLMPGGGSHLNANSLKYGVQQFKPAPAGSPTGFGNFTAPNGYAISAAGVVGGATGMEDSSRMKYKDGNLYVPNPQAETSEIWIQNPRDLPGMQSTPYYNMPAPSPHAAYMPSHASFNAAAAQSSHMQFPGLYHPSQPAAISNPHHMGPAMGGNVGVGVAAAAPGPQVGGYQQPQMNHLNWPTNF